MSIDFKEFNSGDEIKIYLSKKEYKGVLLETPEKGIILLKLNTGYNIGINKKDIFNIKLIKKFKKQNKKQEIKHNSSKPNIGMIITGGTIASKLNPKKGGVDWLTNPEELFNIYPELFEKVNILKIETPFMKASEDMDYKDWKRIAKTAEKLLNNQNIQGIIITHGTDFLHYTASALSFFLKDLNKPVVLTYSQRSSDRASSDANLNLKASSLIAISDIAEIMLVGHSSSNDDYCYAIQGTKARKMHTSKRDAFKSINNKPIAKIYPQKNKIIPLKAYNSRNKNKVKTDLKFQEKTALIKINPGQSPDILDFYIKQGYKGLILEMSGLGHLPTKRSRNSWIKKLKQVQEKGLIICATSQTIYGRLDPLVYSNGREILDTGVIYLQDMLSETALIKLSWVLGHEEWSKDKKTIREKMLENFAGELNNRLEYIV
ncbi:MAG: Glu-tRNA(Gln) amidotransferase subunit GatD [Nanoarchaeota archaeon]